MNRRSIFVDKDMARNFRRSCSISHDTADLPPVTPDGEDDHFGGVQSMDLTHGDLNRLKIFFGSKSNEPLVCRSQASVFVTHDMHISNFSITNYQNRNEWKLKAQGAIVLQVSYDKELPEEVCGARLIIANSQTCDMLWYTSVHSWSKYRCIDEHFHIFYKLCRNSEYENELIPRDYCVGIYFANATAAEQFHEFVIGYTNKVVRYENRNDSAKKEAIKLQKSTKRSKSKSNGYRKSMISAPVMFCHTLHIDK